ncbi:MarR family winged helix-turn-helix transcriptional regulator [Klebsiella oxytoca]|nr:MarR family transcriptional regulator [Klebsiella oxytoca]
MMELEQKHLSLLQEAERHQPADVDNIRLCFQTLSLAAAIDRDCATLLAPWGLSEGRFVLLFLLDAASEGLAPNALAEKAGVTRATITGLLNGLERDRLIERHADPLDGRAMRIALTVEGKQLISSVFARHSRWIGGLFSHLSAQERTQLSELLTKVAAGTLAGKGDAHGS